MVFVIRNREVYHCAGNWFPYVYIPEKFFINQDMSKSLLLNREVYQTSWGGLKNGLVKITSEDLNKSSFKIIVKQKKYDDRIELLVAWEINIPDPINYNFQIEVMTGKILQEYSTLSH